MSSRKIPTEWIKQLEELAYGPRGVGELGIAWAIQQLTERQDQMCPVCRERGHKSRGLKTLASGKKQRSYDCLNPGCKRKTFLGTPVLSEASRGFPRDEKTGE